MNRALITLIGLAATACGSSPAATGSATPPPFVCALVEQPSVTICTLPPDTPVNAVAVAEAQGALDGAPRTATVRYCHGVAKDRPEAILGAPEDSVAAVALCERDFPNLRTSAPPPGDATNSIWGP